MRQDGDPAQMIWNVQEVIAKLSEMVELAAGDIIMTGTPSGVAATVPGDRLECEIEGVGTLTLTIGPPAQWPWCRGRAADAGRGIVILGHQAAQSCGNAASAESR